MVGILCIFRKEHGICHLICLYYRFIGGIIDIAKKTGAIIQPVAVEQYGKHFKINIGENFDTSLYGENSKEKRRAIRELRDMLATLKYEI